ncbi:hypothetical protein PQQ64_26020 [Paraburkholderia graminis]|uniref:hypothetical protein n=1 Tax=Paraburkholderia graminis TaxID=60548 RepID=UPI0038B75EA9
MLDRPEHSEVSAQHFAYDGYSIETVRNVSNAMFASRVAAREQELRAKTRDDPTRSGAAFHTNVPWLERIDAIAPNARSLSFAGIQAEGNDAMFNVEAYQSRHPLDMHHRPPLAAGLQVPYNAFRNPDRSDNN